MALTSIHIQPAKVGAEQHNRRVREMDHIKAELTSRNETWQAPGFRSVSQSMADARSIIKEKTGRSMQAKAIPFREGVAVITEETSMEQLRDFCNKCQEKWGIKALAIYTHLDEGHEDKEGKWKGNLHAHIIWQWYSDETGKSIRHLKGQDFSEMQTLLAECLKMERGKSSDKQHLSAIQFKNQAEDEKYRELTAENKQLTEQLQQLTGRIEKTLPELSNDCTGLRAAGLDAVDCFDRLVASNLVKPYKNQTESRNKLERECEKDLPTDLLGLTRHHVNLACYLANTVKAVSDMWDRMKKMAGRIPLIQFKKGRLAREAELQGCIADLQWQLNSRPRNVGHAEENDILGRLYQAMGKPLVPKGKTIDDAIWDVERLYESKSKLLDDYHDLRKQLSRGVDMGLSNGRGR